MRSKVSQAAAQLAAASARQPPPTREYLKRARWTAGEREVGAGEREVGAGEREVGAGERERWGRESAALWGNKNGRAIELRRKMRREGEGGGGGGKGGGGGGGRGRGRGGGAVHAVLRAQGCAKWIVYLAADGLHLQQHVAHLLRRLAGSYRGSVRSEAHGGAPLQMRAAVPAQDVT